MLNVALRRNLPTLTRVSPWLIRAILGLGVGGAFSIGLFMLAGVAAGSGHGSFIPLFLVAAPLGIGLAVWPAVGVLVALPVLRWARVSAICLLALNYVGILVEANAESLPLADSIRHSNAAAYLAEVIYVVGQIAIWVLVARKRHKQSPAAQQVRPIKADRTSNP